MNDRSTAARVVQALVIAALPAFSVVPAAAQQAPSAPTGQAAQAQGPSSAEKYMNVQVLKDLPAAQLPDAMDFMAASLGVNCGFCHVRTPEGKWAFDKDDKAEKKTARQMLQMTRGLNTQYFEGKNTVTCSSCHQARHEPNPAPPLAQAFTPEQLAMMASRGERPRPPAPTAAPAPSAAAPPAARGEPGRPPAPTETVDQVVNKYVQALGGDDRLKTVTSAVMRGTVTNRAGQASPILVEQTLDHYRATIDSKPPMSRAFDGSSAWLQMGDNVRTLEGVQLAYTSRLGGLGLPLQLKTSYAGLAVGRYDRVNGHDAISLNGRPGPGIVETLTFDRASGLLLRRQVRLQTPLGRLPLEIDYADYRDVEGVKVPFDVRVNDWETLLSATFSEVRLNAPIDAARFKQPK